MSRASDKSKDATDGKAESVGSLASEDEDEDDGGEDEDDLEDDGREETPNLYQNSSLGMYVPDPCFISVSANKLNHSGMEE